MRAGIIGILVFVDRNADGEAHLIAVDNQGGVVAELQLQARQLRAQISAELGIARVVARGAAIGAAGVAAGGQVHHAVCVGGGRDAAHRNRLRIDHAQRINVCQGSFLLLHAHNEGAAPDHGAEERIHRILAAVAIYVFKALRAAVVRDFLSCHGNGVSGDVVRINDRSRPVEVDKKIAHELWRPGVGLRRIYPGYFPVLVLHSSGNGFVKYAAGVAAQRDIHVAQFRSGSAVHGMSVRVCPAQVAVALLLRRQRCGAGLVRYCAGQCRKDLRPIAAACADRDVISLGAQREEDLHVILMDDVIPVFVLGNDGLEEGIRIVAV